MASTGNTQGIRFKISPPSSAPSRAAAHDRLGAAGICEAALLARKAASRAGDNVGAATVRGHSPCTSATVRKPWPVAVASTSGISVGLWLRMAVSGTVADQMGPSQCWVMVAAGAVISGVSGNSSSVWPRSAAGRSATVTWMSASCTCTLLRAFRSVGWAARAASNAVACMPVELFTGSFSTKSPSSGMHSWRHTSQAACSFTSSSLASSDGLKSGEIVSGTGSSSVPSKP